MKRFLLMLMVLWLTACQSQASSLEIEKEPNLHGLYLYEATHKTLPKSYLIQPLTDLTIEARSAYLINAVTGDLLFEANANESLAIASMSKIMTELLVLEAIEAGRLKWEDKVSISDYAYDISNHPGYASVHLEKDQTYTVEELFYAMALRSANGATIALAEAVSGSEKAFVQLMNDKASQLGLEKSAFVNSTGLTNADLLSYHAVGSLEDSNHMSARDLAILVQHVISHYPELLEITKRPSFDFRGENYLNSNWMLVGYENDWVDMDLSFPGVDGLKTGFTKEAGYGFAGTAVIHDSRYISVVIGADSYEDRFLETRKLYEGIRDQR